MLAAQQGHELTPLCGLKIGPILKVRHDLTLSAAAIRIVEKRITRQATVSLPDLQRGGIAVACVTVTAGFLAADVGADFEPRSAIYHTPEEVEPDRHRV